MEAMKLVLAVTLAIISTTTAVDLTLEPGTNGRDVVQACIAIITQPGIFSQDQQLLRRIAYVETRDGTDPDTYAGNNNGGIWQLSETKYSATKTVNQQLLQDIAAHFNIDWTATVWSDLRKPLFSALAARLYFEVITAEIPLSPDINAQGNYWATYYTSSGGTQTEFVNAINELTATEACDISGIDLYFVIDESSSVGFSNFQILKDFIYNIADSFEIGPDDVQIGVMTYSSLHTFHFVLNTYMIKSQVLSAIQSLPYGGGGRNTAGALDAIRLQAFTDSNGARPSAFGIPRVAVVITAGHSNDFAGTVASANLLHDAGVITFAIGIAGANDAELDEIASEPSNKDFVSSFDAQRLRALQVSISQRACEASPNVTIGKEITSELEESETQYVHYPIPESGGITLQVNVNQGTIVLYASSVIQTPNEAFHDIKIVTNSYIYIDPNDLSDPDAEPVDVTITGLRSQDLGGIVIIECTATGKPQPTVEWKKDGVTLSLNNKIVVNTATRGNNTIISTLTTSLASSDAGIYMCIGSNVIQNVIINDTAIVNLEVIGSFITPHFGNQLGGTPVLIRGIFNELVNISCVFGTIETRGVRISETQAMCISPRLDIAGPVEFNVFLNDALVPNNSVRFYAQHYSDLADVTVDPKDLIVSPRQKLNINWITSSLLLTADSDINVDIILHEATVSFNKTVRWIGKYMIRSDVSNDGIATITIPPRLSRSSSSFDEFNSSYSLIVIQIAVSTSSMSNNQYWRALKELEQTTDRHVTVGRWTHVLFRRYANDVPRSYRRRIDNFLCSNWLNSNSSHFLQDSNDLDPCPCNRLQAELPQSGFTPRITPGKKIIDEFLHGNEIVCYEPRSTNDEDAGNGIHIVSQECCYNRQGNLLVGGPYGGSANAQPSSAWENHFVFDLSPFLSCCVMNARYSEYYEKRPSDNCSRYEPFIAGFITPHFGNQLGGTPVLIRGIFNELVNISCVFGTIETRGVRISETQAMCISPRLDIAGPVEFNVFLNDALVPNNSVRFYAQHYSDLADVTVDPKDLIVSPRQKLNINWITSSLLPTADSDINVDIILHEAAVSFNKTVRWIGEYVVGSDLSNDGSAVITIPRGLSRSSSSFDEFSSSYSLIVIQIAVSTSSTSNNRYWMALKELKQSTDTPVTVGRWTHVLFRRYANDVPRSYIRHNIDSFLCSNWLNSNSSHFLQDSNDLDPCPCNRLQAELPQSGFTPRITPGKKIIDEFLHGNEIVCYEPRSTNDEDAGNGIHIVSQECCYNRQGNLLVGGPSGGSANAQPSSAWENHFVFDLSPFLSCCVINARYLEYYEKRPSDNCSRYEPFIAALMSISPHYGNQLGGTPVLIKGISFNELVNITCQFDNIKTRGIRISNREAMCVSPRLAKSGSVPFSVSINDVLVENSVRFFYAQHYSDLADVTLDPRHLIVSPRQQLNINWTSSSLLPTADSDINVDIILHEAAVSFNKTVRWIGEYVVRSDLSNDGSAVITIPSRLSRSSSSFDEFNSSYSLIVIQIAVSTSSASNNQYWRAFNRLVQTTDTHVTVGRWTHVLFRRYANDVPVRRRIDSFLCSNWLNSNSSHFSLDSNLLDPCPCNRLQAELPQSGFTPMITPGKKIIDEFLYGSATICYESKNPKDPGDGIHMVSQECCYNRQGNLLVGGPYGGSANAQPSSAWENHLVFDLSPFLSCCVMSSRYYEYYEKRPSDNCSRYEPFTELFTASPIK